MAGHAAVRKDNGDGTYQTETGWGNGDRFVDRGNWGTFSSVTLTCDCGGGDPDPGTCETAFAFDPNGACFLDIDEDGDGNGDFNRWGWSIGALGEGSYSYTLYAGAGQCDLSKGTAVGTVGITYSGGDVIVTYSADSGFGIEETHVYVGGEILPRNNQGEFTVAPGRYGNIHDDLNRTSSDTYVLTASGNIYVVAHAVVCGDF